MRLDSLPIAKLENWKRKQSSEVIQFYICCREVYKERVPTTHGVPKWSPIHPSTNRFQCGLTSVIGWELVLFTWYGRWRVWLVVYIHNIVQCALCMESPVVNTLQYFYLFILPMLRRLHSWTLRSYLWSISKNVLYLEYIFTSYV